MKIGLAGWSLQRRFRRAENPLQLLDYPQTAREEWGFEAVELNNIFLASHDASYLDQLKERASSAGVEMWGMAVDGTGSLCEADEATRAKNIEACVEYLHLGKYLGLTYMRFNTGGDIEPGPGQVERCADSFAQLAQHGQELGVIVCIENHGGISKTPDPIVEVMQRVNSSYCRTLPDFGNFAPEIRYEALEKVIPWAVACHAKFWSFDENGEDPQMDIWSIRGIMERIGFEGRLALEFEGQGDDGEGVRGGKALLNRVFA